MTQSFWPTPQDYNESIQNPAICIADPDLKDGIVDTNALGLPKSMTGAFASVYKITNGDKPWAVRCFLSNRPQQQERYKHISEFVLMDDLECTIDFHYIENGIKIRGEWFPLLKMPWVEGVTLDRYILKNYKDTESMKRLLSDFHKMVGELERAKISHCDLQHGNVIVSADGLRLVDYDALFVPALAGKKSLEVGHPSYQHPERNSNNYDKNVDNFSAWLIHTAIVSIAIDKDLYEKYCDGDDNLLFRRTDLANPAKSELFNALLNHPSEHIKEAATLLRRMLWASPNEIPILNAPAEELDRLPHSEAEKLTRQDSDSQPDDDAPHSTDAEEEARSNQLADFNFIDADAAMVRATAKSPYGSLTRIENFMLAALIGWDNFHLWFAPMAFVEKQMAKAKLFFDKGDFDSALKIYLKIYKVLEETNNTNVEDYAYCLFRLGCCYISSETPALASNYFLLSLQNAPSGATSRQALYLAFSRFESGDEAGALRLLTDHIKTDYELSHVLKAELSHHLFDRMILFKLLVSYCKHQLENGKPELAADGVYSTWFVLQLLVKSNTVELSEELLDSVLSLLALLKNNKKVNDTYFELANFCIHIEGFSSRGSIAFLCSALRNTQSSSDPKTGVIPEANLALLDQATNLVSASDLKTENELSMLKAGALAAAPPRLVRDTFVRIGAGFLERDSEDFAFNVFKLACQITTDADLPLTESLIAGLEKLDIYTFLCMDSIMQNAKFFKYLIVYLGNSDHLGLLTGLANSLLEESDIRRLSRLFTIVRYGCPDGVLGKLFAKMNVPEKKRENIEVILEENIERLARNLNLSRKAKSKN